MEPRQKSEDRNTSVTTVIIIRQTLISSSGAPQKKSESRNTGVTTVTIIKQTLISSYESKGQT